MFVEQYFEHRTDTEHLHLLAVELEHQFHPSLEIISFQLTKRLQHQNIFSTYSCIPILSDMILNIMHIAQQCRSLNNTSFGKVKCMYSLTYMYVYSYTLRTIVLRMVSVKG